MASMAGPTRHTKAEEASTETKRLFQVCNVCTAFPSEPDACMHAQALSAPQVSPHAPALQDAQAPADEGRRLYACAGAC